MRREGEGGRVNEWIDVKNQIKYAYFAYTIYQQLLFGIETAF